MSIVLLMDSDPSHYASFYDDGGDPDAYLDTCSACGFTASTVDGTCPCDERVHACPEGCTEEGVSESIRAGVVSVQCEWCQDYAAVSDATLAEWTETFPVEAAVRIERKATARVALELLREMGPEVAERWLAKEAA